MDTVLGVGKVTSKGQIAIPVGIRKLLGIKTDDKLLFVEDEEGTVTVRNATIKAFEDARESFASTSQRTRPSAKTISAPCQALGIPDLDALFEGYEGTFEPQEDGFAAPSGLEVM